MDRMAQKHVVYKKTLASQNSSAQISNCSSGSSPSSSSSSSSPPSCLSSSPPRQSSSSSSSDPTSSDSSSSSSSSNVTAFLSKLWRIVNDTSNQDLISWSPNGCSFTILNQIQFAKDLLPLYFKHNNMASFIRQLNMYGFRKMPAEGKNADAEQRADVAHFYHLNFVRGQGQRLTCIKRKVPIGNNGWFINCNQRGQQNISNKTQNLVVNGNFFDEVRAILSELELIQDGQKSSESILYSIQLNSKTFWHDVAVLRGHHQKQRRIFEKMIQFLVSLIQSTNSIVAKERKVRLVIDGSGERNAKASGYSSSGGRDSNHWNTGAAYTDRSMSSSVGSLSLATAAATAAATGSPPAQRLCRAGSIGRAGADDLLAPKLGGSAMDTAGGQLGELHYVVPGQSGRQPAISEPSGSLQLLSHNCSSPLPLVGMQQVNMAAAPQQQQVVGNENVNGFGGAMHLMRSSSHEQAHPMRQASEQDNSANNLATTNTTAAAAAAASVTASASLGINHSYRNFCHTSQWTANSIYNTMGADQPVSMGAVHGLHSAESNQEHLPVMPKCSLESDELLSAIGYRNGTHLAQDGDNNDMSNGNSAQHNQLSHLHSHNNHERCYCSS